MNKKQLIILTAGGSGGHVYPAQALAEEISKDFDISLITDKRGKSNYKGKLSQIPNYSVLAGAMIGKSKIFKIISLFKTCIGILQACYYLLKLKPKCVIGFGGYAAFPTCCAAILLKIDLIIHEQNSIMSRTNRLLAKHAKLIATSFENTKFAPKEKSILVGLPVRQEILKVKNSPHAANKKFNILVLGGSQGAKTLTSIVPLAIKSLSKENQKKIEVVAQSRKEDINFSKQMFKKTATKATISAFFENMPKLYKNANLIISRTGASSIFEIATVARASVLIPLPTSADNHQFFNAQMLKDSAYIIEEKDLDSLVLKNIIEEFLNNNKKLKQWEKTAYKKAIVDSAKKFKKAILKEYQNV